MDEYMTAQEAAEKWGVTVRRVQILCSQGRVGGAIKYSYVWVIPRSAKKPEKLQSGPKVKLYD